ncbi:MAG TPA: NACHT domain-containing protein [Candidatus Dormibacteraeota bacterium]|nr:NACHT domain-containing protein [Candidatus Dormibacteraeota bacterium]
MKQERAAIAERGRHYAAVIRRGDRYVEAPECGVADPSATSSLQRYIAKHHIQQRAEVELGGNTYLTLVNVPKLADDSAYVLVDANGVPVGQSLKWRLASRLIRLYLDRLAVMWQKTESLYPEHNLIVGSQFVRPTLRAPEDSGRSGESFGWEQIFDFSRITLLGAPGSGKSTCLRRIAYEMAVHNEKINCVPIYLQLRYFEKDRIDESAVSRIFCNYGTPEISDHFTELCDSGGVLLLLDGLDELPSENQLQTVQFIRALVDQYPRVRLIVSTRKTGLETGLPGFTPLELQPFSMKQIREWTDQNIKPKSAWQAFIDQLLVLTDVRDLLGNPLMLSLAAHLFTNNSFVPRNRAVLFKKCVDAFTENWDSARNIHRGYEDRLSPWAQRSFLNHVSFNLCLEERSAFRSDDLARWRRDFEDSTSHERFVHEVSQRTGLLVQRSWNEWGFVHRGLQEYCAAEYLVDSTGDITALLRSRIEDRTWQDIWSLSCSISSDAAPLIEFALGTNELAPLVRAAMVAEVLAQGVQLKASGIRFCCDHIVKSLEKEVQHFPEAKMPPVTNHDDPDGLAIHRDQQIDEKSTLRRLLRSLREIRSEQTKRLFWEGFSSSKVLAVRDLCILFSGSEFTPRTTESEGRKIMQPGNAESDPLS